MWSAISDFTQRTILRQNSKVHARDSRTTNVIILMILPFCSTPDSKSHGDYIYLPRLMYSREFFAGWPLVFFNDPCLNLVIALLFPHFAMLCAIKLWEFVDATPGNARTEKLLKQKALRKLSWLAYERVAVNFSTFPCGSWETLRNPRPTLP